MKKIYQTIYCLFAFLNGIILIGDVIELFKHWVGIFAYAIGLLLSPFFVPTIFILPWFDAWVNKTGVNSIVMFIWIASWILTILPLFGYFLSITLYKDKSKRWLVSDEQFMVASKRLAESKINGKKGNKPEKSTRTPFTDEERSKLIQQAEYAIRAMGEYADNPFGDEMRHRLELLKNGCSKEEFTELENQYNSIYNPIDENQ